MNSYIVEESENRRFLGALFLSVLVHAALFLLLKTTGLGFGYSLVGMGRGSPIAVQMGYVLSPGTEISERYSDQSTEPTKAASDSSTERRVVSAVPTLPKPSPSARPQPKPRVEPQPQPQPQPRPETRPQATPEPETRPEVKPEPEPELEVRPEVVPEPEPEPEPEPVPPPAAEVTDRVMETHRQPSEESTVSDAVITSESGVTELPVSSSDAQREQDREPEVAQPAHAPEPVEEAAEEQPPTETTGAASAPDAVDAEPSESGSDFSDGTDEDGTGVESESGDEAAGTSEPAPPPPPPLGGDMIGLGGRLQYPKVAETARGGPIEYTVTFDVLVNKAGEVLDMTVTSSSFNREVDQQTVDQLLRTSELMVRGLVNFKPHTSDYRVSVVLSFDTKNGPMLKSDTRIRPLE